MIANAGEILAIGTIAECMAHPLVSSLFHKVQREEIAPHVAAVPNMTPAAYIDLVERRFSNTAVVDTTRRVAFDGSSRHTGFVLPIVRDALAAGAPIEGLALVEALWARMCDGTREDGSAIAPNDPFWDELVGAARAARDRPAAWLEQRQFYGDLAGNEGLRESFARWLGLIWSDGCEAALECYVGHASVTSGRAGTGVSG